MFVEYYQFCTDYPRGRNITHRNGPGLKRATDEGSLPEIAQYSPYYLPLNVLLLPKDQTFIFYSLLFSEQTHRYTSSKIMSTSIIKVIERYASLRDEC